MNKNFLVTRPNHDPATNYLFFWSTQVIREAKSKAFKVLDLRGKKANKRNFTSYIKKHEPSLVFFNGHGSENSIGGYNDEPLIESDTNELLLLEKIVYARSCNAARRLGENCVNKGTVAFIGYVKKYFLGYSQSEITRPLNDKVAKLFVEPSNLIPISLLKGNTVEVSCRKSQKDMRRNLSFMLSGNASQIQKDAAPYLWANLMNQKVLGNKKARLYS